MISYKTSECIMWAGEQGSYDSSDLWAQVIVLAVSEFIQFLSGTTSWSAYLSQDTSGYTQRSSRFWSILAHQCLCQATTPHVVTIGMYILDIHD